MTMTTRTSPRHTTAVALLGLSLLAACSASDVSGVDTRTPTSLALNATTSTSLGSLGDTSRLTVHVLDTDGKIINGAPVRWRVFPEGVIEDLGDGAFRAIRNGRATIVSTVDPSATGVRPSGYFVGALSDSIAVTVQQVPARLLLTKVDTAFISLGATRPFAATISDARGNALLGPVPSIVFSTSDARIVSVNAAGQLKSMAEGVARVTAQAGALAGIATFTVQPRRSHTSCMVFAMRGKSQQSCITSQVVVHERETTP